MKILIRDVASCPDGKTPKPFPLENLAMILKIPAPLIAMAIHKGTIIELTIETAPINSTKFFVIT